MDFIKKTLASTGIILGVSLMISINIVLASALGAWLVVADIAFMVAAAIVVSHFFNLTIPGMRRVLRRAYYRAKFKREGKKESGVLGEVYLQFLAYLVLLFKSADEGFELIKEEAHDLYSDALIFIDEHTPGKGKQLSGEHLKQLFDVHAGRQRRAATVTVSTLGVFILGVLSIGLISNMIFSPASPGKAAVYDWTQEDWSGGSTADTLGHHDTSLRTGDWNQYFQKSSNLDASTTGEISLSDITEDWTETTESDFNDGTHENTTTTVDINGEVMLLKPVGADCSNDSECVGDCTATGTCADIG